MPRRRKIWLCACACAAALSTEAHAQSNETAPDDAQRAAIAQQLLDLHRMREDMARDLSAFDARIDALEAELGVEGTAPVDDDPILVSQAAAPEPAAAAPASWGAYEALPGFVMVRTSEGELDFGMTTYARFVDHMDFDATQTDSFGREFNVRRQNNILLAKGQLNFRGWIFDPKFNYLLYVWTQNAAQGQGAQVAVAGNISYRFNPAFELFAGIHSVPSTRTTNRTFPMWLRNDNRTIADEYFRGSYTSGIWVQGVITPGLEYRAMVANNLSTLGVDAGQLSPGLNTFSAALAWMPTTQEYGPADGFGDLENHQRVATLFGAHYTHSRENAEAQPGVNDFENSQLHLSDGTLLFSPGAFDTDGQVTEATYQMLDLNAGFKYRGWSLDGEYYWRWVDDFDTVGFVPVDDLFDHGFQLQASGMLTETLQAYLSGSMIFGEYGEPADLALGMNWFPYRNRQVRINAQALYVDRSPVGYLSYIIPLGAEGWGFNLDAVLVF